MGGATRFIVLLSGPLPLIHHRRPSFLRLACHYPKYFRSSFSSSLQPNNGRLRPILSSSFQQIRISRKLHSQVFSIRDDSVSLDDSASGHGVVFPNSNSWPEWSNLFQSLTAAGFFDRQDLGVIDSESEFVAVGELPVEFVRAANACLAFARERGHLLGLLSKRDIEVLVESGSPRLFRDADASLWKMKSFLRGGQIHVSDSDKAQTVDLFKLILSYALDPTVLESSPYSRDLVESSTRNLLGEICKFCFSDQDLKTANQFSEKFGPEGNSYGRKVEMKRGDWNCPRCNFMNFARNVKCLECEETRPKRQLTGGEWECPQCDFFNYGRNTVCLRCDCKRPRSPSLENININSGMGYGNGSNTSTADIDSRLAANEEKAQRWFSRISQLDSTSDLSTSITDDDFPEIMPLRKGVNRFVVSTRKTPLERRLADAHYRKNLGNDGASENNISPLGAANNTLDETISQRLDDILSRAPANSQANDTSYTSSASSGSLQSESSKGSNSSYVPFVPLPPDMFAKKPENSSMKSEIVVSDANKSLASNSSEFIGSASQSDGLNDVGRDVQRMGEKQLKLTEKIDKEKEEAEKSERWFKRVSELHNETDLASAISDEDFPEIMPMRKGENKFVVSKKKDRSLTSPAYKRRVAMEQAGNSNFVPFVPFPPDYFAKKDKPLSDDDSTSKEPRKDSSMSTFTDNRGQQLDDARVGLQHDHNFQLSDNQQIQTGRLGSDLRTENIDQNYKGAQYEVRSSRNNFAYPESNGVSSGYPEKDVNKNSSFAGSPSPASSERQNIMEKWSGKSLEGSAVTEPDPLDMSEEAKAQRWFRRVAQIKDISELSQIPDEDFPSIMPMRKGVNRFVISKRKTPLERRLTSPQYRRNLPIVSSEPPKKENDES